MPYNNFTMCDYQNIDTYFLCSFHVRHKCCIWYAEVHLGVTVPLETLLMVCIASLQATNTTKSTKFKPITQNLICSRGKNPYIHSIVLNPVVLSTNLLA